MARFFFGKEKARGIECIVDFMLDDSPGAIRQFLTRSNPILNSRRSDSWKLDLTKCSYLGPDAAAILLAMVLEAKFRKRGWEVILPQGSPKLRTFCEFSGLNHHLFGKPAPREDHPDSEVDPLRIHVKMDYLQTPYPFIRLVRKHLPVSKDMEDYLVVPEKVDYAAGREMI